MALRVLQDPLTGEPVEVAMPYADWVWYVEWVRSLAARGLPIPKFQAPPEVPPGLPDLGDPLEFQRRLRDEDDSDEEAGEGNGPR